MVGFLNACRFRATTTGAGDFVVSSAVTGYQTPAQANATNGETYRYRAESSDLSQWEIGYGVYTESTTTLARTTIIANSLGGSSPINFTAAPQVGIVAIADDFATAAPDSVEYIVGAASSELTAERVVTDTTSITWDLATAAQAQAKRAALTGDVTASANSNATTIADDAVTFAKMQDIATDSLIGRDTASTGDPENITLNATLSMTGSGALQRAALTGDVTASAGSNSTTIADGAVTNAKLADMAQNTIKGRVTASTGDPEDLTATQGRTVLGLGTAATQNTGTSGANVPLLNAANTWSSAQTFSAAIGLTSGQIDFPATQVPSAGANTLDDYEEGTWTPAITFDTPGNLSVAYSVQTGTYTKIGRMVMATFDLTTSSFTHTTAAGDLLVTGLPFASGGNASCGLSWGGITKAGYTDMVANINSAASQFNFIMSQSGAARSGVTFSNVPTGGTVNLRGTIVYNV